MLEMYFKHIFYNIPILYYKHFLQMVGLLFVIIGVWIYNDVIIMPLVRNAMKRPEAPQAGRQRKISRQRIIGSEDKAGNQRIRKECIQSEKECYSFCTLNVYK